MFEAALEDALGADLPTVIHLELDPSWVSVDRPATQGAVDSQIETAS